MNTVTLFSETVSVSRMPIKQSEALLKFKQLLDSGAITQDDFERMKAEAINKHL